MKLLREVALMILIWLATWVIYVVNACLIFIANVLHVPAVFFFRSVNDVAAPRYNSFMMFFANILKQIHSDVVWIQRNIVFKASGFLQKKADDLIVEAIIEK